MNFEAFIADGRVRKGEKDFQKAKALLIMAEKGLATAETIPLNNTSSSIILTISYESLREILEAICLREGYKIYSHEAYTAYLKELGEEKIAFLFDRLRILRNGVNYYGKAVSIEIAQEAKKQSKELSALLKEKYIKAKL